MKLHVDSTLCQGYGLCKEQAPALVDLDEWGYASVPDPAAAGADEAAARAAVDICPAAALRLTQ